MKITKITQILLGLIYFVFGLNGFLQFLPMPALPESAGNFLGALAASNYFFPVLKGTEVIGGISLLAGLYAPLFLVILAPITLQILLFHAFLTPGISNSVLPIIMVVLHLVAAKGHWNRFIPLLQK